jgi:hypothetical protein
MPIFIKTHAIAYARNRAAEALQLECKINDLVNQAYGLTPEEIELKTSSSKNRRHRLPLVGDGEWTAGG